MNSFDLYSRVVVPSRAAVGIEPVTYRKFFARTMAALDSDNLDRFTITEPATGRKVEVVELSERALRVALSKEPAQVRNYANSLLLAAKTPESNSKRKSKVCDLDAEDVVIGLLVFNAIF